MSRDPTAIRQVGHDAAVKATGCAQVQILDAGILAQGCELQARCQLFAVTFGGLAVDQQAKTLFEREDVEGGRPALFFERRCNAGQAPNRNGGQQSVMGGMGQHFGPLDVVMADATNVGVLEGGRLLRSLQGRPGRGRSSGWNGWMCPSSKEWASTDGHSPLAGRIDAFRPVGFDQGQHTQTGAEALLGMRTIGHHHLAKGGHGRAGLGRLGQHSGPNPEKMAVHSANRRCAEGIWSATVTWLRRPGVRTWLATRRPRWNISTVWPLVRTSTSCLIRAKGTEYQELSTST